MPSSNKILKTMETFVEVHSEAQKNNTSLTTVAASMGLSSRSYKARFSRINTMLEKNGYNPLQPLWGPDYERSAVLKSLLSKGLITKKKMKVENTLTETGVNYVY